MKVDLGWTTASAIALTASLVLAGCESSAEEPEASPTTPQPSATTDPAAVGPVDIVAAPPLTPKAVQAPLTEARIERLPWRQNLEFPEVLSPSWRDAQPLSAKPISTYALVAYEQVQKSKVHILVLGDDDHWRRVDVPGLKPAVDRNGYGGGALQPNSLTDDGYLLAIPQRDEVVVVDLRAGTWERYDVPGFNQTVLWDVHYSEEEKAYRVLVGSEERRRGTLIDLTDGTSTTVPFNPGQTSGHFLELTETHPNVLLNYQDTTLVSRVRLSVDASTGMSNNLPSATAATPKMAIVRAVTQSQSPGAITEQDGLLVLNHMTGKPLVTIPIKNYGLLLRTTPLGWPSDDDVIYRVGGDVIWWNLEKGDLERVAEIPVRDGEVIVAFPMAPF